MSLALLGQAIVPVVNALDQLGIDYAVGGSVASSAHGIARSTVDIDLVVAFPASKVDAFVAALEAEYYVDAEMIRDALRRQSSFNLIHLGTMLKIDVYLLSRRPFDRESFGRRQESPMAALSPDRLFQLERAEDVVLHKLDWYRIGGEVSDRQWTDVLGVLKVQASSLDLAYLRRWAGDLGVLDLLERAFVDAGLTDQ